MVILPVHFILTGNYHSAHAKGVEKVAKGGSVVILFHAKFYQLCTSHILLATVINCFFSIKSYITYVGV